MRLIFATGNKSKLKEAMEILSDYEIVSPMSLGIADEIEETGATLEENSLIKARAIYAKTGEACFADDTGLEVDALDGAPGVQTARYAGQDCDSVANMNKLLAEIAACGEGVSRKARFRAIVTLILADGSEYQFEGRMEGSIAKQMSGCGGFGYDPIFMPDAEYLKDLGIEDIGGSLTLAELSEEQKNAISHRGDALQKMRAFLCSIK